MRDNLVWRNIYKDCVCTPQVLFFLFFYVFFIFFQQIALYVLHARMYICSFIFYGTKNMCNIVMDICVVVCKTI
jgi:hypothetical protein